VKRHADLTEHQLIGSLRTITALLFLKYVKHSLYQVGSQMLEVLQRAHEDPQSREISRLGMRTLAAVKDREEMEHLQTIARKGRYDRVQKDEMTYAEELRQEGFKRGFEQGVVKSKQTILMRILSRRFSVVESERRRVESCEDRDSLDAAIDEVFVAESKESVLEKLP
jgi:flagellar biosynthesis/type III secretory pathway protein FliH